MNSAPRQRGRPRKFDRDLVLDRAVITFWANGYNGTSLDMLTDNMGINRPSLYAAFGNKHELFTAAIDRYATTIGRRPVKSLQSEPDIKKAVAAFFSELIRCLTSRNKPRGCLVANVASELAGRDATIRDKISQMVTRTDNIIADRLRSAQDEGQLSQRLDTQALARMIVSIMQCLATRARVGASRKELFALADDFVTVLFSA